MLPTVNFYDKLLSTMLDLTEGIIKNVRALIWKKEENGEIIFLITQEPSGSFTMPGGRKDLEDADLVAALRRELREELGLNPTDYSIQQTDIQKEYDNLYNTPEECIGKKTSISVFIISGLTKEPSAANEIKSIAWMTAEEAINAFNKPHFKELFTMATERLR